MLWDWHPPSCHTRRSSWLSSLFSRSSLLDPPTTLPFWLHSFHSLFGGVARQKIWRTPPKPIQPHFIFISFIMTMFVVKRDGKRQSCQFDKIQSRISKLCYGLDQKVSAACLSRWWWRRRWGFMYIVRITWVYRLWIRTVYLPSSIRPHRSYTCVK